MPDNTTEYSNSTPALTRTKPYRTVRYVPALTHAARHAADKRRSSLLRGLLFRGKIMRVQRDIKYSYSDIDLVHIQ